jgi:hypothetical protein
MTTETKGRAYYREAPSTGTVQMRFAKIAPPIASGGIGVIPWGTPVQEPRGMFAYWRDQAAIWAGTAKVEAREAALVSEFRALATRWRNETAAMSNPLQIAMHPDYQAILARGKEFLPFILEELREWGGNWYIALRAICRAYGWQPPEIPANVSGDLRRVNEIWLQWGRERGRVT